MGGVFTKEGNEFINDILFKNNTSLLTKVTRVVLFTNLDLVDNPVYSNLTQPTSVDYSPIVLNNANWSIVNGKISYSEVLKFFATTEIMTHICGYGLVTEDDVLLFYNLNESGIANIEIGKWYKITLSFYKTPLDKYPTIQEYNAQWVRNPEWISQPVIAENEDCVWVLVPVFDLLSDTEVSFKILTNDASDIYIDWGDGSSLETVLSNIEVTHSYSFSDPDLDGTLTYEGYKQSFVKIYPVSGTSYLSSFRITGYTSTLEIIFSMVNGGEIRTETASGRTYHIQNIEFTPWAHLTYYNLTSYSLERIDGTDFSEVTSRNGFNSYALKYMPEVIDFSSVTNPGNIGTGLFSSCTLLKQLGSIKMNNIVGELILNSSDFYELRNLVKIESLEYSATGGIQLIGNLFRYCYNLEFIKSTIDFGKSNAVDYPFLFSENLKKFPICNLSSADIVTISTYGKRGNCILSGHFKDSADIDFDLAQTVPFTNSLVYDFELEQNTEIVDFSFSNNDNTPTIIKNQNNIFSKVSPLSGNIKLQGQIDYDEPISIYNESSSLGLLIKNNYLKTIGTLDFPNLTNIHTQYLVCYSLKRIDSINAPNLLSTLGLQNTELSYVRFPNAKYSINLSNNTLSRDTILLIFGDLATLANDNDATITLTGNYGCDTLTPSDYEIATNKGWQVVDQNGTKEGNKPIPLEFTIDTTKTDNVVTSTDQYKLPLHSDDPSMNLYVDWGDSSSDTITNYQQAEATHTYTVPGVYTIKITGNYNGFWHSISSSMDNGKLISVDAWGNQNINPHTVTVGYFYKCSNLISIPDSPLSSNFVDLRNCFQLCSSLTSIPSNLFENHTAVTSFQTVFMSCTSLTSIPAGLFANNSNVEQFDSAFSATGITSIPAGLFDNNPNVDSFLDTFSNCTALTTIPEGLFDNNINTTNFYQTFSGCSSLTTIPTGLFDNNPLVETFYKCFQICGLTSIPTGLFDNNPLVQTFYYTFAYNNNLTSLPTGLFNSSINATSFYGTFYNCTSLTSIPAGLFDNCGKAESFLQTFRNCPITSIPEGLFDDCISATTFQNTFYNTDITAIPTGLFDYNPNVTSFFSTFYDCTSLTTIPEGLFDNNPNVTNFAQTFYYCSSLTTIPDNLVLYNTNVTTYQNMFNSCSNLVTAVTGTGGFIDDATTAAPTALKIACFTGCVNIIDYDIIPTEWGGLGLSGLTNNMSFRIVTTSPDETFTLPINNGGVNDDINVTVEWGDTSSNTITTYDSVDATHTFSVAGTYDITITGYMENFQFNNNDTHITHLLSMSKDLGIKQFKMYGQTNLVSIDSSFNNLRSITSAVQTFNVCTSLTTIPTGLFDNNPNITSFYATFNNTGIMSIPTGLFDNNPNVTSFNNTFQNCPITSIPTGLFDNNPLVESFAWTFSYTDITSIPTGLFDNNINVTSFQYTFYNCSSLTTISDDLILYNTAVTTYQSMFQGCNQITTAVTGTGGFIDDATTAAPTATKTACFNGCTSIADYASIPVGATEWRTV